MSEHNNAPAVPQGLERYEPTVMVEESRGRLTATGAVMKPKEDGRWVRLRDLTATPAPAPAQEFNKSVADAEIKALYVESQGSDKGWLGIEGSYFIGGVVAARRQKKAPAPAQERCSTCGYLTSEREHLGCLRRAVKDLDIATGGPYDAQGVGLTDEGRQQVFIAAERRMVREPNLSWRDALVDEVIAALRAKGQS